jgi:hypothetical protein
MQECHSSNQEDRKEIICVYSKKIKGLNTRVNED